MNNREERKAVKRYDGKWECQGTVYRSNVWFGAGCSFAAKYDPDENGNPTKCKAHSEEGVAKRREKQDAKYREWQENCRRQNLRKNLDREAIEIVRQIAAGHNDPRSLCADWVKRRNE